MSEKQAEAVAEEYLEAVRQSQREHGCLAEMSPEERDRTLRQIVRAFRVLTVAPHPRRVMRIRS